MYAASDRLFAFALFEASPRKFLVFIYYQTLHPLLCLSLKDLIRKCTSLREIRMYFAQLMTAERSRLFQTYFTARKHTPFSSRCWVQEFSERSLLQSDFFFGSKEKPAWFRPHVEQVILV